jgi:hypothetical protein
MKRYFGVLLAFVSILFMACNDEITLPAGENLHHIFPNEFGSDFAKMGIDVNKFTIPFNAKSHQDIHNISINSVNYNNEWKNYIVNNPNASQKDLYNKAEQMLSASGVRGDFKFYDYKSRQLSGVEINGQSSMICLGQGWFWRIIGSIANWLGQGMINFFGKDNPIIKFLAAIAATFLAKFGIKTKFPVLVGLGVLLLIFAILAVIGIIYIMYLIGNILLLILFGASTLGFAIGWFGSIIAENY